MSRLTRSTGKAITLMALMATLVYGATRLPAPPAEAQSSDAVTLHAPTTLRANGAELAWSPYSSASGAPFDRYEVHRSETAGFVPSASTLLTTIRDVDVTTYVDTTAGAGRPFSYRVVANSTASNEQRPSIPIEGRGRIELQPGAEVGKASYLQKSATGGASCANHGASETLFLGGAGSEVDRPVLQFDLHDIPGKASVLEATLSVYRPSAMPAAATVDVHRLRSEWDEGESASACDGSGATWDEPQGGVPWHQGGGDIVAAAGGSVTRAAGAAAGWDNFDVKGPVQEWLDGAAPNHGVALKARDEAGAPTLYYVSDDSSAFPGQRPKLVVKYADSTVSEGPVVAFKGLADGAPVTGSAVALDVEATDDRRVERVDFSVDGVTVGSDTAAPWSATWDSRGVSNADHTITAKATDDVGNTTSESVQVAVANTAVPATKVLLPSASYTDMVSADAPVAFWRLGEASGATAADASGNGATGTLSGGYLRAQAGLLIGNTDKSTTLQNATTDGKLTAALTGKLADALTAEAWVNYTGTSTTGGINRVVSRGWGASGGWLLALTKDSTGQQRAYFSVNASGTEYKASAAVTPGKLHLAGRYSGSGVKLYVNGTEAASVTAPAIPLNASGSVTIGGTLTDTITVDEVALYPTAVLPATLAMHSQVGSGRTATVSGNGARSVAEASDDRGVSRVEFFIDGEYQGQDTAAPFDDIVNTTTLGEEIWNGDHAVTSRAYDAEGQPKESTTQTVKVDNAGGSTAHTATIGAASEIPAQFTRLSGTTQDPVDFDVALKNTTPAAWAATDVVLRPRWIAPDGTVTDQADVSLGSDLLAGQTRQLTARVTAPPLPEGTASAQYTLRVDAYRKSTGKLFASMGNKPLDKPVTVRKSEGDLGLEDWQQYDGEELGGGMQHLTNVFTGNSIVRFTPMSSTGRGLSTVMDITYNSLEDRSESPLGDNWSLSISSLTRFGTPLDVHPNNADTKAGSTKRYVDFTDGDGTVHRFTGVPNSTSWNEPAGVHLYLRSLGAADPERRWAITRPDGVTFYYDADGYPTSVEDKNANRLTFTLQTVPAGEDPGGQKKRITAVTDAAGRAYTIAYYSKETAPKPRIRGRIASIKDHSAAAPGPAGVNELQFQYYDDGNLRRILQVAGRRAGGAQMDDRSWFFTYTTSDGSGPAIPAAADRQVPDAHTPNQSTRLFSVRDPRRHETTFTYRGPGGGQDRWRLTSRTDRLGKQTAYAYNGTSRTTTVTAPLARVWKYGFDAAGQVTSITNPLNEVTTVGWTPARHVETVTTPTATGTATQRFAYNANGMLTSHTNEESEQTVFGYTDLPVDAADTGKHLSRLSTKTSPKGVATTLTGDYQWSFAYDSATELGNLVRVTDPEDGTTTLEPNPDGTVRSVTDPNGNLTTYEYDPSGQPSQVSQRVSPTETRVTWFDYDADGFLRWVQDPRHAGDTAADVTSYRTYFYYDTWHRLGRQSTPKSVAADRGNLIWTQVRHNGNDSVDKAFGPHYGRQWSRGGALSEATYDAMDRVERTWGPDSETDPLGERWRYSYDDAGRLIQATDPRGMHSLDTDKDGITRFKYDGLDRLTRVDRDELNGATVVRTLYAHSCYDKAGDLVASLPPAAGRDTVNCAALDDTHKATRFGYDKAHRPVSEQLPGKPAETTAFDDNGNVEARTDAEGVKNTVVYDERDLPVKLVQPFKTGKDLISRRQYDGGGRLIRDVSPRAVDHLGDKATYAETDDYVTSYQYNGVDELTLVRLPRGGTLGAHYVHRGYDRSGNLASVSQPVESATDAPEARLTKTTYWDTGWVRTIDRPGRHKDDQEGRRTVQYDYTAEGWQERMTPLLADGSPHSERERAWGYYADGMLREQRDGDEQRLDFFRYDANNQLTFAHDSSGLNDETKQKPIQMTVDYDSLDRPFLVRQSDSESAPGEGDWHVTKMGYNPTGTLDWRIDNRVESSTGAEVRPGQRHTYTYDPADWLRMQTDFKSPTDTTAERLIETTYKPTGRIQDRTVSKGGTVRQRTTWDYFLNGKLKTLVTRAGDPLTVKESHTVDYQENGDTGAYLNGHRARDVWRRNSPKATVPCQNTDCTTTWSYDARDRLTREVRDRETKDLTTDFTLTPSGSIDTQITEEAGKGPVRIKNHYTGDQLRKQEHFSGVAGDLTATFLNWHDPVTGSLTCVTRSASSTRDDCNATEGNVPANLAELYSYDDDDKLRSSRKWNGAKTDRATYDYDALDRQVTQYERHTGLELSGQVKLTRKSYLGASDKVSGEQHYDVSDFDAPSSDSQLRETKNYSYDANGWRVGLTDIKKDENGGPDKTNDYLYGYDPHRNVSQLLTENGAVRASYGYSAYGDTDKTETAELKSDADDGATDDKQYTDELSPLNPYRYSDKRYDSGSGQLDMGARRFGPSTGQFLQEDVLKDALGELALSTDPLTANRYSLAAGNPISFVETDGHMPIAESGYTAAKIQNPDAERAEDGPTTGNDCASGCGPVPNYGGGTTHDATESGSEPSRAVMAEIGHGGARQVATERRQERARDQALEETNDLEWIIPGGKAGGTAKRTTDKVVDAITGLFKRRARRAPSARTPDPTSLLPQGPSQRRFRRHCSFSARTRVVMADGSTVPISEVEVGDLVLATDPLTGQQTARRVTHLWVHHDDFVRVNVRGHWITTTSDHPFWNDTDKKWEPAAELDAGDAVATSDGGSARLSGVDLRRRTSASAYNLTVEGVHTYHVGKFGVLVHNTCGPHNWRADSAADIARGHAGQDHALDFPGMSLDDLATHTKQTMTNPAATKDLNYGRKAYRGHDGTVVVHDPNHPDAGTVFRPSDVDDYWDTLE